MQLQQHSDERLAGDARDQMKQTYILIATLFVAAILLLFRNMPVGPIPAGDEFQYSMMSRLVPYAQDWIPSYLYYFVYSSTNYCGPQYYACAKLLNVLFLLLAAVFVFLTSRLFAGWLVSFLIMVAFLASPFNVFSSMFMPETMYAAVAWMLLYFFVSRVPEWTPRDSVITGVGVAALSMIKPHGVFLGIVFLSAIIFDLWLVRKAKLTVLAINAAALIVSFLAVRLPLGALFAGMTGLSIFGIGYGSLTGRASFTQSMDILRIAAIPALRHAVAMTLLAGIPLCILLARSFSAFSDRSAPARLNNFSVFFFVVMIAVTSVFTAMLHVIGMDTLERLIRDTMIFSFSYSTWWPSPN